MREKYFISREQHVKMEAPTLKVKINSDLNFVLDIQGRIEFDLTLSLSIFRDRGTW